LPSRTPRRGWPPAPRSARRPTPSCAPSTA